MKIQNLGAVGQQPIGGGIAQACVQPASKRGRKPSQHTLGQNLPWLERICLPATIVASNTAIGSRKLALATSVARANDRNPMLLAYPDF